MLPKYEIREQASQAVELIEKNTSKTIWRTSMRIHELIILENPNWKNNIFLMHRQNFLHLLHRFCFGDSFTAIKTSEVYQLWERYEESEFEPTLFQDIYILPSKTLIIPERSQWSIYEYTPINVRQIIKERWMFHFMKQGFNFDEANTITDGITPEERDAIVQGFIKNGMIIWNIFYKQTTGSHDSSKEKLPELPATIN